MKGINKSDLIRTFMEAEKNLNGGFVYVIVELPSVEYPELIINPVENVFDKLDYYMKHYNDNMELIANRAVRVIKVGIAEDVTDIGAIYEN